MKKSCSKLLYILLIFWTIQPVFAFQEQQRSTIQAPKQSQIETDTDTNSSQKKGLTADKTPNTSDGTEVYIPGLGKLGMLPKMDFGLELLYGPKDEKQLMQPNDDLNSSDNLRIRGSLKHSF